ncbi:hypothetical protein CC86DRAFT_448215 [Ophiobolus disseminans]|uniref:Uncharacterized protein n=1 Tax=Ophiobolus disseminans TaxID=1469910 RepID=A0A6A6ZQ47_9PLEO|nr:hypothetical protein CC86DRAFT_448215 [Ophiobolus disseminans]
MVYAEPVELPHRIKSTSSGTPTSQSKPEHTSSLASKATHFAPSFLAGLAATFGQHFLYSFLHHKREDREDLKTSLVLFGRALAYLAKVAFAQCIAMCYHQRIWRTFRNRALSVRSIDLLYSGIEDASLLVNWEAVSNAPLVVSMAIVVWLLPLATVIASPSALSFEWRPEVGDAFVSVPTLNFSIEAISDWRKPVIHDGGIKKSTVYYNISSRDETEPGIFDYYDQPSSETQNHLMKNIFSSPLEVLNSTFNQEIARQRSCGGNYNCTYTASFLGPGYKCEDVTNIPGGLFNTSVLVPEGAHVYYANVDTGEYRQPQLGNLSNGPGGYFEGDIPNHAGDFQFEPEIWIGYAFNTSRRIPDNSSFAKNWTHQYEQHIMRCIHYETKYTVDFNFTGHTCQIKPSTEFVAPVHGFNFSSSNAGILPIDQWLSPRDNKTAYKKVAAYHAIGEVFRDVVRGKIIAQAPSPGPYYLQVLSDVTKTSFLKRNYEVQPDISTRLENLYQGIVLSFLTQPTMLINSDQKVLVHRSRYRVAFVYNSLRLWICYAPVILVTLAILLIGAWTVWEDGTTFSTGFARILATTRNPTLDEMSRGACLGNDPFPVELMQRKLQFGALQEDTSMGDMSDGFSGCESVGHCAFGVPAEVAPIRRGMLYAGLGTRTEVEEKKVKLE